MENNNSYLNYFNFMKNLKNAPDNGMAPLIEWQHAVQFFARTLQYLISEWDVDVDQKLDFGGCKVEDYPAIFRHRSNIAEIVIKEFRQRGSVNNAALGVLEYLRSNDLCK